MRVIFFLQSVNNIFDILNNTNKTLNKNKEVFRIGISDSINVNFLFNLIRFYQEHEPQLDVKVNHISFADQLEGIVSGYYDVGFCLNNHIERKGVITRMIWEESLVVLLPSNHDLLTYKELDLQDVLRYPIIGFDINSHCGYYKQIKAICNQIRQQPLFLDFVESNDLMLTLVAANYGIGLMSESRYQSLKSGDIVVGKKLSKSHKALIKTYMLTLENKNNKTYNVAIEMANSFL